MIKYGSLLLTGAALAGCASVPDVTYTYYLAKSNTVASVTQTITCNDKKNVIVSYATPVVTTTNMADYSRPEPLSLKGLDSSFADNSFTMTLTPDGRLKSANATWIGQAQTIAQSAITLGATALAFGAGGHGLAAKKLPSACDVIASRAADGKTLTFVYTTAPNPVDLGHAENGNTFDLDAPPGSPALDVAGVLRNSNAVANPVTIPTKFVLKVTQPPERPTGAPLAANPGAPTYPGHIKLQRIARVQYDIEVGGGMLSAGTVIVPRTEGTEAEDTYVVPITGATPFGTESFTLTLADDGSGTITTSTYGDNAGTAASNVINVVNSGLTAAKPQQ
jgi:hypothetical protein